MDKIFSESLRPYIFCVVVSLVWFSIHIYLNRKQKRGETLSKLEKDWFVVSKIAGYTFLVLPIISDLIIGLGETIITGYFLIIAAFVVFSMMIKNKK